MRFNWKKLAISAALALAAIGTGLMFWGEHQKNMNDLARQARRSVYDGFSYNGSTYTIGEGIKNYTKYYSLVFQDGGDAPCTILNKQGVYWSDAAECLVYQSGHKIYRCDLEGKNRTALFTVPVGRVAQVMDVCGAYAIVRGAYKTGTNGTASQGMGYYYLVNLISGDAVQTDIDTRYSMSAFCIEDGCFYYAGSAFSTTVSGQRSTIYCYDIESGTSRYLTEISGIAKKHGCILDGYLYYRNNFSVVYRVPVTGGEAEWLPLDYAALGADNSAKSIAADQDRLLMFCFSKENGSDLLLLSYDPAEDTAEVIPMEGMGAYTLVRTWVQEGTLMVVDSDNGVYELLLHDQ